MWMRRVIHERPRSPARPRRRPLQAQRTCHHRVCWGAHRLTRCFRMGSARRRRARPWPAFRRASGPTPHIR